MGLKGFPERIFAGLHGAGKVVPRAGIAAACGAFTALLLAMPLAQAGSLPVPAGEVLLVVSGKIDVTNAPGEARFDRNMLESLGVDRMVTKTPWHRAAAVFEGVRADRVMRLVKPRGSSVLAIAANDYHVTIPLSDFAAHNVLLAMRIDGKDLRLRTKGPIWMIYPADANLPSRERHERMIWQLVELRVN